MCYYIKCAKTLSFVVGICLTAEESKIFTITALKKINPLFQKIHFIEN